jgi:putative transposase
MTRIIVPREPHHVVVRGNNRRNLFSYPRDYERFIWDVGRALDKTECLLHALALMPNHVHMIVRPQGLQDMADFVKRFSQRYAVYRNRMRKGTGKLFEQKYKSSLITNEVKLAEQLAYVDLNPVRAGLVDRAGEYRWSTAALHLGYQKSDIPRSIWTPSDCYEAFGNTVDARGAHYEQWLEECLRVGVRPSPPEFAELVEKYERLSIEGYTLRLRRPNGSRAADLAIVR